MGLKIINCLKLIDWNEHHNKSPTIYAFMCILGIICLNPFSKNGFRSAIVSSSSSFFLLCVDPFRFGWERIEVFFPLVFSLFGRRFTVVLFRAYNAMVLVVEPFRLCSFNTIHWLWPGYIIKMLCQREIERVENKYAANSDWEDTKTIDRLGCSRIVWLNAHKPTMCIIAKHWDHQTISNDVININHHTDNGHLRPQRNANKNVSSNQIAESRNGMTSQNMYVCVRLCVCFGWNRRAMKSQMRGTNEEEREHTKNNVSRFLLFIRMR